MKIKYRDIKLSKDNKVRLQTINSIIQEYQDDGYVLTLRQLYYQLVSRDVIPNQQKEYAKLSKLLKEGRMSGIVDWSAIEDRLREPEKPASFDSPEDILQAGINQYQVPRMEGQSNYLEVWVEKDALSGVLKRITEKYHVPIVVNRGYSSITAMHDAFDRFTRAMQGDADRITVIYLGDYDPSGIDMIRDVKNRILEFSQQDNIYDFEIAPIALTRKQIEQYDPPPNPAKMTDPRAGKYVSEHGTTSWEVDALPPKVLNKTLEDAIVKRIDVSMYENMVAKEAGDKERLQSLFQYL